MLYRIVTEDCPPGTKPNCYTFYREHIIEIVSRYFDGFTLIPCLGYWQGKPENTIIIEIIAENAMPQIRAIAKEIRTANKQQSVLISWSQIGYTFIEG